MSQCPHCGAQANEGANFCAACGQDLDPRAGQKKGTSCGIVAIIVTVVVIGMVFVIGVIAALLIPNFLDALQKARQKRTIGDLRNTGIAVMSYYVDAEELPPVRRIGDLDTYLVPDYLPSVPRLDAWKNEIRFSCWSTEESLGGRLPEAATGDCDSFALISAGADGKFEHDGGWLYEEEQFDAMDYDRDIVLRNGFMAQYPAPRSQ